MKITDVRTMLLLGPDPHGVGGVERSWHVQFVRVDTDGWSHVVDAFRRSQKTVFDDIRELGARIGEMHLVLASEPSGMENEKVAPGPSFDSVQRRP